MESKPLERKLTAILYADVAGYSRLTGEDEEGTHRALSTYLDAISASIEKHHGKALHFAGDAVLADFATVSDALICAAAVQEDLKERNKDFPDDRKVQFRIGVNLGEVIVDRKEIYGDGVNVAARLQSLAEPGGICISESVHTAVGNKLPLDYEFLGEQSVKNIEKPVRAYSAELTPGAVLPAPSARPKAPRSKHHAVSATAAALALVIGAGVIAWLKPWAPDFEPASVERMAFPLPDKPSIAVLPFDNYSDDTKLNHFASGLTEDLTSALSQASRLFVIARNSAAKYKGKAVDVKQVAEELGVQYVLEGSVQKAGDRLRITAQLVDALNGRHLWAGRFDRKAGDIFAVQDEIVKRVFAELAVKLTEGDRARTNARATDNLDAWLLAKEGYSEFLKFKRESNVRARELWQASLEFDPNYANAMAGIAFTHYTDARWRWSADRAESIRLGKEFAERAIRISPDAPLGYQALGSLYLLEGETERGIALRRKAADLAPNDFSAVGGLAIRLIDVGGEKEAIPLFERALRLSPSPPWWVPNYYGVALHHVGRKEEAVEWFKKAVKLYPKHATIHARLAAAYVDLGRMDEAKAAANEVLRLKSDFTVTKYQKSNHYQDPERNAWLRNLLLRAGLPE